MVPVCLCASDHVALSIQKLSDRGSLLRLAKAFKKRVTSGERKGNKMQKCGLSSIGNTDYS